MGGNETREQAFARDREPLLAPRRPETTAEGLYRDLAVG